MQASQADTAPPATIAFEHPFFKALAEAHFRVSDHTRQPTLMVRLGELDAALSLSGIKGEFGIADNAPDGRMLDLVARGLRFVRVLRIGDPVPRELLTGEASWSVTDRHRQIALHRLTVQLVTWWSGAETPVVDREQLLQIAEDPAMRQKASQAVDKAAERLGLERPAIEQLVQGLAGELAYIEALRERLEAVGSMGRKIQLLRRRYGDERGVLEIADPVARLMTVAETEFTKAIENLDAQTAEIVGALKNVEGQRRFIQEGRDDLFARLLAWDEMLAAWGAAEPAKSDANVALLRKTYQFLAPRFMQADAWVLASKLAPLDANALQAAGRAIPNSKSWW